jgi:tetratricopeptide (TPR) repeat protein
MASYRDGDLDRALADFDQAILLDPSSKSAYINRSIVLYRKAEIDRAFADVAQASRIQESLRAAQRSHSAAARN